MQTSQVYIALLAAAAYPSSLLKANAILLRTLQFTRSYMSSSKQIQPNLRCDAELQIQPSWRSKASLARS